MKTITTPTRPPDEINKHGSKVYRQHRPRLSRSDYDLGLCRELDGWRQFDTGEDSPLHGIWVNLAARLIVTFIGDYETIRAAPSADVMRAELAALENLHGPHPFARVLAGADEKVRKHCKRPGPEDVEDDVP